MKLQTLGAIIGVLILVTIATNWLKKLGIITDTKGEKDDANFSATSSQVSVRPLFDPNEIYNIFSVATQEQKDAMWNTFSAKEMTYIGATKNILAFPGLLNDDEDALFASFKVVSSIEELAWFSNFFYKWVQENWLEVWFQYDTRDIDEVSNLGSFISFYVEPSEISRLMEQLKPLKYKFITQAK